MWRIAIFHSRSTCNTRQHLTLYYTRYYTEHRVFIFLRITKKAVTEATTPPPPLCSLMNMSLEHTNNSSITSMILGIIHTSFPSGTCLGEWRKKNTRHRLQYLHTCLFRTTYRNCVHPPLLIRWRTHARISEDRPCTALCGNSVGSLLLQQHKIGYTGEWILNLSRCDAAISPMLAP